MSPLCLGHTSCETHKNMTVHFFLFQLFQPAAAKSQKREEELAYPGSTGATSQQLRPLSCLRSPLIVFARWGQCKNARIAYRARNALPSFWRKKYDVRNSVPLSCIEVGRSSIARLETRDERVLRPMSWKLANPAAAADIRGSCADTIPLQSASRALGLLSKSLSWSVQKCSRTSLSCERSGCVVGLSTRTPNMAGPRVLYHFCPEM